MAYTYKYRFDRRTLYSTAIGLVLFAALGAGLYRLYEGGYLSAWFTSFVVAVIALMALSIPRHIVLTDSTVEVRCLLDITELRRDEIASVRRVDTRRMKWIVPVFGSYGFFGYYGHFFDLKQFKHVRLYASEWRDFVEITDLYEERLYVSCRDADRLVEELTPAGGNRTTEEDEEEAETNATDAQAAEGSGAGYVDTRPIERSADERLRPTDGEAAECGDRARQERGAGAA